MTPEATDHLLSVYLVYISASIGLTIWLARTLFKNGEVFLEEVFADNPRMASAVNRLLVVGFYLLNLGYAFVTLKAGNVVSTRAVGDRDTGREAGLPAAGAGRAAHGQPVPVPPHPPPRPDQARAAAGVAADAPQWQPGRQR